MNNDIQWSTSQSVIDVKSYNDNDNDNDRNPIIGPRDWSATETAAGFQAKFGQMSPDILLENVSRHPPSAGIILPEMP